MNAVVTAAEMREIDRITIEDAGIAGVVLMENAGRQTADVVRGVYEDIGGGPVTIVCGRGNNGGDGFVVARYLQQWGIEPLCVLVGAREAVGGDALVQLDIVDTLGVTVIEAADEWPRDAKVAVSAASVVVDALFGTGLNSELRGIAAIAVAAINASGVPVVAVDIPSGVAADSGAVLGVAVEADVTVTFGLAKRGLMVHPGCDLAGEVMVVDIGIPSEVVEHVLPSAFTSRDLEPPYLPPRRRDSHKGQYGHVLVVGGSPGKGGAALMAGMAALRLGAGMVTVLTDARCQPALEGRCPELMVEAGWAPGKVEPANIRAACIGKDAVVVGPGLEPDETGAAVVEALLAAQMPAVIVDAGALSVLAQRPALLSGAAHRMPVILTPHPGEAGRLLGLPTAGIQGDRFAALALIVERTGAFTVLKGARTLIGGPESPVYINETGNPGMATAGTGDVLAGMVGALCARGGLDPLDAARTAVHLHGLGGDAAAAEVGVESLIATDLIHALPAVLRGEAPGTE